MSTDVSRRTVLGAGAGLAVAPTLPGVAWAEETSAGGAPGGPRVTDPGAYLSFTGGAFSLVGAPVVVSPEDHPGVVRVAGDLRDDIERVTGVRPGSGMAAEVVLVGTIGRSPLIDGLIAAGKLDVGGVRGEWETSLQTVVERPMPGVERAFVIAGSDPRGTIFGVEEWERGFARQNFGAEAAAEIAEVLGAYGQLQARRKPELLNRRITVDASKDPTDPATGERAIVYDDQETPFFFGHCELERVTEEWRALAKRAERLGRRLPAAVQDAWFELVGYAVAATANLYGLRAAEFENLLYAGQGRAATNGRAAAAEAGLARDFALADRFNSGVAGGKWRGFQTQPHIGYGDVERYGPNAGWQQPEKNHVALPDEIFPKVRRIEVPEAAELGVAVDGADDSGQWWPGRGDGGGSAGPQPVSDAASSSTWRSSTGGVRPSRTGSSRRLRGWWWTGRGGGSRSRCGWGYGWTGDGCRRGVRRPR